MLYCCAGTKMERAGVGQERMPDTRCKKKDRAWDGKVSISLSCYSALRVLAKDSKARMD